MKHYQLQADEVILYRGPVNLLPDGKLEKPAPFRKAETDVILTNKNIVIDVIVKKLFGKSIDTMVYDVNTVKRYQEIPQVIQKKVFVDIYLLDTEIFLQFPKAKDATNFVNAALRLLTGQSKLVRGVKKAQKAVKETEEQLDVDITGTAKAVAATAVEIASGASNKKVKAVASFANIFSKKKKEQQLPPAPQEEIEEQ